MACRSRDLAFFQDLIKELTVLGCIHILCRGTKDRHAHLHEGFGQLDRGLSAELYYCAVRLFNVDDAFHILRGQRLKIQLICDIEVGTYGLRVVVNNNGLIAFPGECPGAVYGTEVELDTLADTDRAGTENQNLFLCMLLFYLADAVKAGVVIRCLSRELCRAGIYHFVSGADIVCMAHGLDLILAHAGQSGNDIIRELDALCFL